MEAIQCDWCGWAHTEEVSFGIKIECPTCRAGNRNLTLIRGTEEEVKKRISDKLNYIYEWGNGR